jgi:hypothetical protein
VKSCPIAWAEPAVRGSSGIYAKYLLKWDDSCAKLSKRTYNSDGVPEAHRRTLIGDRFDGTCESSPQVLHQWCEEDPKDGYDLWRAYFEKIISTQEGHKTQIGAQASGEYFEAAKSLCFGRTFCNTTGGRIGL